MHKLPKAERQPTNQNKRAWGSVVRHGERPGYYVRFRWGGRRVWRYGGPTKRVAENNLARIHAALSDGHDLDAALAEVFREKATGFTFREAVEDYLVWAASRKKASTLRCDRNRLAGICTAAWANEDIARIRHHHLQRHVDERLAGGAKPASVNREISIVSALFKWAASRGYVRDNPARNVLRPSEKGNEREVYLSAVETRALIKAASGPFRAILLCAFHTGMRRGEILSLRWPAVDIEAKTLRVGAANSKTREGRTLRLSGPLLACLVQLREERGNVLGGYVFAPERRTPDSRAWVITHGLKKAKEHAENIDAAKLKAFRFHDARHTAASLMVAQGVPLFDVGKILGHKTAEMTLRYAHFAPEAGRAAIDALERALG